MAQAVSAMKMCFIAVRIHKIRAGGKLGNSRKIDIV